MEDRETLGSARANAALARHRGWVNRHGLDTYASPRFGDCLMSDVQCLEPTWAC
ncbi:hypothetical protein BDV10DRAFT_178967 [Aspergillus recurvatus]